MVCRGATHRLETIAARSSISEAVPSRGGRTHAARADAICADRMTCAGAEGAGPNAPIARAAQIGRCSTVGLVGPVLRLQLGSPPVMRLIFQIAAHAID